MASIKSHGCVFLDTSAGSNSSSPSGEAKPSSGTSQASAGIVLGQALHRPADADQASAALSQAQQGTVVMALAAAKASAGAVDGDQRHEHQVRLDPG